MDPLRQHDAQIARQTPPSEKLSQALEAMKMGLDLKRATFERTYPDAPEEKIDRMMLDWLLSSDTD